MNFRDVVVLLPCESIEELSLEQGDRDSAGLLGAWSAAFHPALVRAARRIPRWGVAERPPEDAELDETLILLPGVSEPLAPKGWLDTVAGAGGVLLRGLTDRAAWVSAILDVVDVEPEHVDPAQADPELTADLLALGFCHLQVELLTRQLRYMSSLDEGMFETAAIRASEHVMKGETAEAKEQIQAAFDLLAESREYFYPSEPHLIDLTLVAPTTIGQAFRNELASAASTNVLIGGATLEEMAQREPDSLAVLRAACDEGRVSLIGGTRDEPPFALLGFESIRAAFARGKEIYERRLGRSPAVFGRRRWGLWPGLPDVAAEFGFRGALHVALDGVRVPGTNQSRVVWDGAGGATLEALARTPGDASRHDTFLRLPERLGETFDVDQTPTAVLAHWPGGGCCWLGDLKRIARYTPALGRFVRLDDYFADADGSTPTSRFAADAYRSPQLAQAVAEGQADPISRWVRHHRRRATLAACESLAAMEAMLRAGVSPSISETHAADDLPARIDEAVEEAEPSGGDLDDRLSRRLARSVEAVADALPRRKDESVPGRLIVNPWSFGRSCVENGADAPAMGFSWVQMDDAVTASAALTPDPAPKERREIESDAPRKKSWFSRRKPVGTPSMVEGTKLRNEFFEIELDQATGAIRRLYDFRSRGNRLSAQLAFRLANSTSSAEGAPSRNVEQDYTIMAADDFSSDLPSAGVGEVGSRGRLVDREGRTVARFSQTFRARRGCRVLEWEIELEPTRQPEGSPWRSYYAARLAWNGFGADVSRGVNLVAHPTEATMIESPFFVDVRSGRIATTLLTGGLPFHRLADSNKLDSLLIVSGERARRFRLGIGIDLAHPAPAAMEFLGPAGSSLVVPCPAPTAPRGWLFHVNARNVVATAWEPLPAAGRPTGFRARLLETEGVSTKLTLRAPRELASAQQTDLAGQSARPLVVAGDGLTVELRARQWVQVEGRFGD